MSVLFGTPIGLQTISSGSVDSVSCDTSGRAGSAAEVSRRLFPVFSPTDSPLAERVRPGSSEAKLTWVNVTFWRRLVALTRPTCYGHRWRHARLGPERGCAMRSIKWRRNSRIAARPGAHPAHGGAESGEVGPVVGVRAFGGGGVCRIQKSIELPQSRLN